MASSFPAHQICILSCLLSGNRIQERRDCKQRPFHVKQSFSFSTWKLETVDIKVYALHGRLKYRYDETRKDKCSLCSDILNFTPGLLHMHAHLVYLLKIEPNLSML
jgi:hypothetical protein